ncbi:autophagy protein atg9 [Asimina triloba]
MSTDHKGTNSSIRFKWPWRGESSLTTGLLNDPPPEIELSSYQRLPSSGSESPSGFLNGESLKVEAIADLDLFFGRIYSYYCEKGLWCIVIKWILELLSLGFTICFSGFFLLFVDWHGLRNAKCGIDAVESGIKPCDLAKEALHRHPLVPFTFTKGIIVGYLGIFSIYWVFCFLRFFAQLKDTLETRHFYYNSLNVTDCEIQTMPWAVILEKVVQIQRFQQLCVVKDLSAHEVVMRIMRKENYLIGMLNKGFLAFPIPQWLPGAGPAVNPKASGQKHHLILTKTLEWTLNWCILQSMFDRNFCVRRDFISNPNALKKRLMAVGFGMLLISPFLVIFMLVYLFLRHAEQFYNHPSIASSRRWSNLSKWVFREFNEVDHLFRHRIDSSVVHAADYLKQFPSPIINLIAKFISFVSGGFAAILIIIAFLEESLLEGHIFGRQLFWYAAVFGTVTAISRAVITNEFQVLDQEGAMSLVVQHTHYMPKRWRGKENTDSVRMEFETLFQLAVIFLLRYASWHLSVQPAVYRDDVIGGDGLNLSHTSFTDIHCTKGVDGVGDVCSFQSSYPPWEPNLQGHDFILNLRNFREKQIQCHETQQAYSPTRTWKPTLNSRGHSEAHGLRYPRPVPQNIYNLDSLWSITADQRTHPYLLDWYYTFHTSVSEENSSGRLPCGFQMPHQNTPSEPRYEENWGFPLEDRMQGHYQASTSAHIFQDCVPQQHDSGHSGHFTNSHWWDRSGPKSTAEPEASFLEPPLFGHHDRDNHYENFSDASGHEQQGSSNWRNPNASSFMDDCANDDREFNLPFNDVYARPLKISSDRVEPESEDYR